MEAAAIHLSPLTVVVGGDGGIASGQVLGSTLGPVISGVLISHSF